MYQIPGDPISTPASKPDGRNPLQPDNCLETANRRKIFQETNHRPKATHREYTIPRGPDVRAF